MFEGLCSLDSNSRFYVHICQKQKCVKEKQQLVQISSRLLAYIYTCVLSHIRMHICWELVRLDCSGPPCIGIYIYTYIYICVLSQPLGSHRVPIVPHEQCGCVCLRTHTHTQTGTLTPVSKIEKTQDNTFISVPVKSNPPRQSTAETPKANKQTSHTRAHVHTLLIDEYFYYLTLRFSTFAWRSIYLKSM